MTQKTTKNKERLVVSKVTLAALVNKENAYSK